MPFDFLPQNKHCIQRWVGELVGGITKQDQRLVLKSILLQRVWVSPMLKDEEVFIAFIAACRRLAKHRSVTRLKLENVLLKALRQWQKVPLPQKSGRTK